MKKSWMLFVLLFLAIGTFNLNFLNAGYVYANSAYWHCDIGGPWGWKTSDIQNCPGGYSNFYDPNQGCTSAFKDVCLFSVYGGTGGCPISPPDDCCYQKCRKSVCNPDCSCAANTCSGSTCGDGCGGSCSGTKAADCSGSASYCVGTSFSSANGCGSCSGTKQPSCSESGSWGACTGTPLVANQTINLVNSNNCGSCNPSFHLRSCSLINSAYWMNLRGAIIDSTNVSVGDSVLMGITGYGVIGKTINYTIYQKEGASFVNLWGLLKQYTAVSLNLPQYTLLNSTDYYFNSSVNNSNGVSSLVSPTLSVSSVINDATPVAIISFPPQGYNASINNPVSFNHTSYDEDDLLNVTWNFGDGQTYSIVNYSIFLTPGLGNIGHSYANAGTYIVTLNVTEMTRGKSSIDTRTIQVFQPGLFVYPVITPINNQAFVGLVALFNASASYVINCSASVMAFSFPTNDGKLNCSYFHAPGQRITNGYNLINNWTIQGQNEVYGNWSNLSNVEFSKVYSQGGTYLLFFKLRYLAGLNVIEANKTVSFSIDGGWSCNTTNVSAFWQRGASRLNATNNCALYNSSYVSSCCPSGYTCDGTNCVSGVVRNYCSDFTTQASCIGVSRNSTIARNSAPNITVCNKPSSTFNNGTVTCYNRTSCLCTWQNGNCTSGLGATTSCPNQPPIVYPTSCFWTYTVEDNCNTTSTRILRATPNIISAGCESSSQTLACVQTAKLDFITNFSLVIIILLIILVYIYLVRKQKSISKIVKKKKSN